MGQWDAEGEIGEEFGDDGGFEVFGVHEGQRVVVMHHEDGGSLSPDFEHGGVDDVGQGTLRIICDSFSKCCWIITTAKEISFTASKADDKSKLAELVVDSVLPLSMCREGAEVLWLEV